MTLIAWNAKIKSDQPRVGRCMAHYARGVHSTLNISDNYLLRGSSMQRDNP